MPQGGLTEMSNDAHHELTCVKGGVIHWCQNGSEEEAVALVVGTVPENQT